METQEERSQLRNIYLFLATPLFMLLGSWISIPWYVTYSIIGLTFAIMSRPVKVQKSHEVNNGLGWILLVASIWPLFWVAAIAAIMFNKHLS